MARIILIIAISILAFICTGQSTAIAQNDEAITTYQVTLVRAAPGEWRKLKLLIESQATAGEVLDDGRIAPFRFRHSQGDHWDFMLIAPINASDWRWDNGQSVKFRTQINKFSDFLEDWIVKGPSLNQLRQDYKGAGLFHVEIFRAQAGKFDDLVRQRHAENNYLRKTGQVTNSIFQGQFGADWDVMTIGFHDSLKSFASDAPVTSEEKEQAAKDAGFSGLDDLAPYLRSLIISHNDTLAVPMN